MVITIPFYLKIKSPELNGFKIEEVASNNVSSKKISDLLMYSLCFLMFCYLGLEITFGGWISSFATLTGVTDNRGATVFPSIFWIFMTFFRILLAFAPGSSSKKLGILILANVASGIISLLIIAAGYTELTCYLSGFMYGLSMSSIYPLILTFPIEAGLSIEDNQTSNMVMAGVVS